MSWKYGATIQNTQSGSSVNYTNPGSRARKITGFEIYKGGGLTSNITLTATVGGHLATELLASTSMVSGDYISITDVDVVNYVMLDKDLMALGGLVGGPHEIYVHYEVEDAGSSPNDTWKYGTSWEETTGATRTFTNTGDRPLRVTGIELRNQSGSTTVTVDGTVGGENIELHAGTVVSIGVPFVSLTDTDVIKNHLVLSGDNFRLSGTNATFDSKVYFEVPGAWPHGG